MTSVAKKIVWLSVPSGCLNCLNASDNGVKRSIGPDGILKSAIIILLNAKSYFYLFRSQEKWKNLKNYASFSIYCSNLQKAVFSSGLPKT
mmetsp:Transcript_41697/g.81815  ORF Transcript_41697/g.81815 Transcript_41697/m.81815 type:complete len:90 (+) Transcript_41697:346-615(+)